MLDGKQYSMSAQIETHKKELQPVFNWLWSYFLWNLTKMWASPDQENFLRLEFHSRILICAGEIVVSENQKNKRYSNQWYGHNWSSFIQVGVNWRAFRGSKSCLRKLNKLLWHLLTSGSKLCSWRRLLIAVSWDGSASTLAVLSDTEKNFLF